MDEDVIKTIWLLQDCPETFHLEKYGHVNPFLDDAPIVRNHRPHGFVFIKKLLYFHDKVKKAASMKQIFYSGMFYGEDTVREVWKRAEEIMYQCIGNVYFMRETA